MKPYKTQYIVSNVPDCHGMQPVKVVDAFFMFCPLCGFRERIDKKWWPSE